MNKFAYLTRGTPVNAVNASKVLTVSGVVVDGEKVTIDNPSAHSIYPTHVTGTPSNDVYEFVSDVAKTVTTVTNIAVDIAQYTSTSNGVLTLPTQPTAGDTMTIGTKVYTFVADGDEAEDGDISVGTDLASAKLAIVAAIKGLDSINTAHPLVTSSAFAGNDATLTAFVGGTVGDTIPTTETFTAVGNVFAAVTLGSGVDCTAANAITALVAAITASDTQGVGAADGAGDTVVLTADVAGTVGNLIVISETMGTGAFASSATKLSGGVDSTEGPNETMYIDDSYLYVSIKKSTKSTKNWRRITVGSAF